MKLHLAGASRCAGMRLRTSDTNGCRLNSSTCWGRQRASRKRTTRPTAGSLRTKMVIVIEQTGPFGRREFDWENIPSTLIDDSASVGGRTMLSRPELEEFLGLSLAERRPASYEGARAYWRNGQVTTQTPIVARETGWASLCNRVSPAEGQHRFRYAASPVRSWASGASRDQVVAAFLAYSATSQTKVRRTVPLGPSRRSGSGCPSSHRWASGERRRTGRAAVKVTHDRRVSLVTNRKPAL